MGELIMAEAFTAGLTGRLDRDKCIYLNNTEREKFILLLLLFYQCTVSLYFFN